MLKTLLIQGSQPVGQKIVSNKKSYFDVENQNHNGLAKFLFLHRITSKR